MPTWGSGAVRWPPETWSSMVGWETRSWASNRRFQADVEDDNNTHDNALLGFSPWQLQGPLQPRSANTSLHGYGGAVSCREPGAPPGADDQARGRTMNQHRERQLTNTA